jgi:hypothetical protein
LNISAEDEGGGWGCGNNANNDPFPSFCKKTDYYGDFYKNVIDGIIMIRFPLVLFDFERDIPGIEHVPLG